MFKNIRQNLLLILFVVQTLNLLVVTGFGAYFLISDRQASSPYDIIDCADSSSRVHKCIRIDPAAGEVTDRTTGASYRVIYGH